MKAQTRRRRLTLEPLKARRLLAAIIVNTTSDSDAVSQVLSLRQAIEPIDSTGNVIGGTDPGDGNEIAVLNGSAAVTLNTDNPATNLGTVVEGNSIGTNPAGTASFGKQFGINVSSFDNAIGDLASGAGNLIANSTSVGIEVSDAAATGNKIISNRLTNT